MNIEYFEIEKLPVMIIDDFYDKKESKEIIDEMLIIQQFFSDDPAENASAWTTDENGNVKYLKNASGCFVDDIFQSRRDNSKILTINRKIFDEHIMNTLIEYHYFYNYIKESTRDTTIVHYYDDGGEYDYHRDNAIISVISWFYVEPKCFSGGELVFGKEDDLKIVEPKNGRMILIPSMIDHKVLPVKMEEKYRNKNLGRFSMAQFIKFS